jgi:hypothetical protein
VAVSTFGVLFLGTPHKGSDIGQWGAYLECLCSALLPKKILDTQPHILEALRTNSETLQNIDRQFSMLMDKYHLYFFHEGKPTDLKGTHRFVSLARDENKTNLQPRLFQRNPLLLLYQTLKGQVFRLITRTCVNLIMKTLLDLI